MAQFRHLDVKKVGVVTVASFRDQKILDDLVIQQLGEELYQLAGEPDSENLLLNFTRVEYISSSMLGKLITLNKKMKAKGGKFKLCQVGVEIGKILFLTNLDRVLDIQKDETDGLMAFYN